MEFRYNCVQFQVIIGGAMGAPPGPIFGKIRQIIDFYPKLEVGTRPYPAWEILDPPLEVIYNNIPLFSPPNPTSMPHTKKMSFRSSSYVSSDSSF